MTETQKRIEAYQKVLPDIKEKVAAVAMLLALSVIMLTSASFAWLTISRAPEVTSVATNVAANGNLEIALAKDDFSVPDESKVGDSVAAADQEIVKANITWGNLVNLNDDAYGLNSITLRPALLSGANNLLEGPLMGADYGEDGRLGQHYREDFQFTSWVIRDGKGSFEFLDPAKYGVRAISTTELTNTNHNYSGYVKMINIATGKQQDTDRDYVEMIDKDAYINALAGVIGDFMTDRLNGKNQTTPITKYMAPLYALLEEFYGIVESYSETIVALANAQVYNRYPENEEYLSHIYPDWEALLEAYNGGILENNGVSLSSISEYIRIKNETYTLLYGDGVDVDPTSEGYQKGNEDCFRDYYILATNNIEVTLADVLNKYVNKLVEINSCQIIYGNTVYTVSGIGKDEGLALLGKTVDAVITNGILKDFEELSNCRMCAKGVTVKATYIFTVEMTANTITTSAGDSIFSEDKAKADLAAETGEWTGVAKDTYGMAIDYWLRTNSEDSYVILEGNVLSDKNVERETGVDVDGEPVQLWTVSVKTTYKLEDGSTEVIEEDIAVYKDQEEDEEGNLTEILRNANNHSIVRNTTEEDKTITVSEPIERYKEVIVVNGYEGENRVWEKNQLMDSDTTTQGNGSCYVFYAEDPGQQEYCIRLLSNLRVAFLDADENSKTHGRLVAIAKLDTENKFEENGKVILPLVLFDDGSRFITVMDNGDLAIYPLEKNKATKFTTIVYLNGKEITNADVLEASSIQGQLNIQFGTTQDLDPIENEDLAIQKRSVIVVASTDRSNFPTENRTIEFDYDKVTDDNPMTVHLRLQINGDAPAKVSGFFMRKVNEFQGSKGENIEFEKEDDGYYYAEYTFKAPGEYVMKTVQLDGIDYTLAQTEETENSKYPHVMISGFNIRNISMSYDGTPISQQELTIMTGDRSVEMDLEVELATDQKEPRNVRLQFVEEDGSQVFASLSKDTTDNKWKGSVEFSTSGNYEFKNIIMDNEYTEVSKTYQRLFKLYLGLTVDVNTTVPEAERNLTYKGSVFTLPLTVEIFDNTGEEIKYLSDVQLRYGTGAVDKNIDTRPSWDSTEDCYKANIIIPKPGVWKFISIKPIKNEEGTVSATIDAAPVFTCMSEDPVSFAGFEPITQNYYIDSTDTSLITLRFKNAGGATATLKLKNAADNNIYTITTSATGGDDATGISEFTFDFKNAARADGNTPAEVTNQGLGNWIVEDVSLINVVTGEGENVTLHDSRNPKVYTEEVNGIAVELVSLAVKVTNNGKTDAQAALESPVTLNKEELFLSEEEAENPIVVTISDHNGNPLKNVSITNPTIEYKYNGESKKYGGYEASGDTRTPEDITLNTKTGDNGVFELEKIKLSYAGIYVARTLSFSITHNGEPKEYSFNSTDVASGGSGTKAIAMPKYIRETAAPSLTVDTITPSGEIATSISYSGSKPEGNYTLDDKVTNGRVGELYEWNVYAKATNNGNDGAYGVGNGDAGFVSPTITFMAFGLNSGDILEFTIPKGNSDKEQKVSITGNSTSSVTSSVITLGNNKVQWAENETCTYTYTVYQYGGHGTFTISEVTVKHNNATYTIYLKNPITIKNPSSIPNS